MTVMMIFFHNNDWHNGMNTVIPGQTVDDAHRIVRSGNNNCAQCSAPENENETKSDVNSGPVGRAKSKLTTTGPGLRLTVSVWIIQNVMKFRSQR